MTVWILLTETVGGGDAWADVFSSQSKAHLHLARDIVGADAYFALTWKSDGGDGFAWTQDDRCKYTVYSTDVDQEVDDPMGIQALLREALEEAPSTP